MRQITKKIDGSLNALHMTITMPFSEAYLGSVAQQDGRQQLLSGVAYAAIGVPLTAILQGGLQLLCIPAACAKTPRATELSQIATTSFLR